MGGRLTSVTINARSPSPAASRSFPNAKPRALDQGVSSIKPDDTGGEVDSREKVTRSYHSVWRSSRSGVSPREMSLGVANKTHPNGRSAMPRRRFDLFDDTPYHGPIGFSDPRYGQLRCSRQELVCGSKVI